MNKTPVVTLRLVSPAVFCPDQLQLPVSVLCYLNMVGWRNTYE